MAVVHCSIKWIPIPNIPFWPFFMVNLPLALTYALVIFLNVVLNHSNIHKRNDMPFRKDSRIGNDSDAHVTTYLFYIRKTTSHIMFELFKRQPTFKGKIIYLVFVLGQKLCFFNKKLYHRFQVSKNFL